MLITFYLKSKQNNVKEFTDCGIELIASICENMNFSKENLGARRLHELMETILEDALFEDAPEDDEPKKFVLNKEYIMDKMKDSLKPLDLKKFVM